MKNKDILSAIIAGRNIVTWVTLVGVVAGAILISVLGLGIGWAVIGVSSFLLILVNSLVIVQPGNAGYLKVFEVLRNKSYSQGIHLVVPFISTLKEVDVRLKEHKCTTAKMMNKNLREVVIDYVLNYRVNESEVHLLHKYIGEDKFMTTALCPWLDSCISQVVAEKEYSDINGKIKDLQDEIQTRFEAKVKSECLKFSPFAGDMFSQISVSIQNIEYDTEYKKSISELAVEQNKKQIMEAKKEQLKIQAEGEAEYLTIKAKAEAEALRKKAEAEADALRLKGASENEVKEKLGEILKNNPELLKEVLAKNFPKVYGGNSIINLDDLLNGAGA
jgi:regulator of protease activity HflC (stomatin/prohibitin superfamily)